MPYTLKHIGAIIQSPSPITTDAVIAWLLIDSRRMVFPETSLFFALAGPRRDGHDFITEVYERGVRYFVVSKPVEADLYPDACFLQVEHVLQALQTLGAYHRSQFHYPVIGITGSNGKTIVKEWLYQLLQPTENIVRNPRSYNSQVGVPLSVWQMNAQHSVGIFEAGISTVGEMEKLQPIIAPTLGILTNIGEAHKEGFVSNKQKLLEKLMLFKHCSLLIYAKDTTVEWLDIESETSVFNSAIQFFSWSRKQNATLRITAEIREVNDTIITTLYQDQTHQFRVPFTDAASIDNAITCICTLLASHVPVLNVQPRLHHLQPLEMRMQLKKGIHQCYILNDSYSNDISSLSIALDYLTQQAGNNTTTVILSDIFQSGLAEEVLYQQVAAQLKQRNVHKLIGIGQAISKHHQAFKGIAITSFFASTSAFLQHSSHHHFNKEYILLKGARIFAFEKISHWLEQKVHQTVMEINLSAMVHNLKQYQEKLLPTTRLMAMVKAFSYGSGSVEVARLLQFHKVDYLAVAYTDEAVELRQSGISLPIMVMNIDEAAFDALIEHHLEPEIFSINIYEAFHQYLQQQGIVGFPVHLKLNTGMNRLGFEPEEIVPLTQLLQQRNTMVVTTVFSHLVASETAEHDGFTLHQSTLFNTACNVLAKALPYTFIRHLANSSGIFRHPQLQYDMVRLGIGLYGVDSATEPTMLLQPVATLKTTIAQIRTIKANETVGYNRRGIVSRDSLIATLRIGYADGFNRKMSNGKGAVFLHGQLAPVIGNVCMDMVMIDVTDIPIAKEGDMVEVFGKHIPVQKVASWCETIPYEIMTTISQRVKRIYVEE